MIAARFGEARDYRTRNGPNGLSGKSAAIRTPSSQEDRNEPYREAQKKAPAYGR